MLKLMFSGITATASSVAEYAVTRSRALIASVSLAKIG